MDHSKYCELKTTFDLVREALQTRNKSVVENESVDDWLINYIQKTMLAEKDGLHQAFHEPEVLNSDLEKLRKKLDSGYEELNKSEALIEYYEKLKLEEDKKKREKEEALKKVPEMKCDEDAAQEKIKERKNEVKTKMDETDELEKLNQALVVKQRQCYDELQEARKELIKYLARGEHVLRVFDEQKVLNTCRGSDVKFNKDLMTEVGKLKMKLKQYKALVIFTVCALFFIMFIPRNW